MAKQISLRQRKSNATAGALDIGERAAYRLVERALKVP